MFINPGEPREEGLLKMFLLVRERLIATTEHKSSTLPQLVNGNQALLYERELEL